MTLITIWIKKKKDNKWIVYTIVGDKIYIFQRLVISSIKNIANTSSSLTAHNKFSKLQIPHYNKISNIHITFNINYD